MKKTADRIYYVAYTPGLRCTICGKDISGRTATTKYCYECAKKIRAQQAKKIKEYTEMLKARDTVMRPCAGNCKVCGSPVLDGFEQVYFCFFCGQRIKEESNDKR